MKFLVLLGVPVLLNALQTFENTDQFIKCIIDCEDHVTPCIKDEESACWKDYRKCIDDKDPFTCFSSSNNLQMSKIVQCMDTTCTPLEKKTGKGKQKKTEEDDDDDFEEVIIDQTVESGKEQEGESTNVNVPPATDEQSKPEEVKQTIIEHEKEDYIDYNTPQGDEAENQIPEGMKEEEISEKEISEEQQIENSEEEIEDLSDEN